VKTFTNGLVDLGGTVGEAGKDYIDALTFQSNEVDHWIIPPTGVSPTIDSSGN